MTDKEYDDYFDKIFKEHTRGREDHEFRHFNHAMGIMIYSKEHYKWEMKKRRMVPYEETERLAEKWDKEHPQKEYDDVSPRAKEIIASLKMSADANGNIVLGGRAIEALQEIGAIGRREHAPKQFVPEGGFR